MRERTVLMTDGAAHAYYIALKALRREMAEYYRDHTVLIYEVANKYKVSPWTVKRALDEFEIPVDRNRQFARTHKNFTCPDCKQIVRHYCKEKPEKLEVRQLKKKTSEGRNGGKELNPLFTSKETHHRPQEQGEVPPGTPAGWTPEMVARKIKLDAWMKKSGRMPTLAEMDARVWDEEETGESELIN